MRRSTTSKPCWRKCIESAVAAAKPTLRKLRHFRLFDFFEEPQDNVLGAHAFGLSLKIGAEAVAEDGDGNFFDVVDGHAEAAVHRGKGFAAVDEILAGAGAGAPIDELLDELRRRVVLRSRRADEARNI